MENEMKKSIVLNVVGTLVSVVSLGVFAGGGHGDHGGHGAASAEVVTEGSSHHGGGASGDHHAGSSDDKGHASSVGMAGKAALITRTIKVELLDTMRFAFDVPLELKKGDVVQFDIVNKGVLRHEFSIGSESEQVSHRAMMQKMPNMVHADANTVTLEAGESKTLIWQFEGDGIVELACNIPGHSEAGMFKKITLTN